MMMRKNSEIEFYTDCIIVESILSNDTMIKTAGISISQNLLNPVKDFIQSKIDPDNKVASFLAAISPYAVYKVFDLLGFKWIKYLMGLLTGVFNKNIKDLMVNTYEYIKSKLISDEKLTSEEVKQKVDNEVDNQLSGKASVPSDSEENSFLSAFSSSYLNSNNINFQIRNAKLIKLALISYKEECDRNPILLKNAGFTDSAKAALQGPLKEALKKFIYWFFVIALSSAGFLVAGDAVNKMIGRTTTPATPATPATPTDKSKKPAAKPAAKPAPEPETSLPASTQKKFKVKASYKKENRNQGNDVWQESYTADLPSIKQMVLDFAKDVYDGLNNLDNVITNTSGFNTVVRNIYHANRDNLLSPITILPVIFHSKKDIVDSFIDEVAANTK